ncbi:ABC transporter ATP-binding protein, partial [Mycobacterium tuberculosis]
ADRVVNLQGGRLIPAVNRENQTDQPASTILLPTSYE